MLGTERSNNAGYPVHWNSMEIECGNLWETNNGEASQQQQTTKRGKVKCSTVVVAGRQAGRHPQSLLYELSKPTCTYNKSHTNGQKKNDNFTHDQE